MVLYREKTQQQIKRQRRRRVTVAILVLVLAVACVFGYRSFMDNMHEQGAASVSEAVMNAAQQCCAVEGSYPSSLQYLIDNYNLRVNEEDYVITYEAFASNVMPSVVVIPR